MTPSPGGLTALGARLASPAGPSLLELRPGIQPDAVSLPTILRQMAHTPHIDALIDRLVAEVSSTYGIQVPPALIAAARANPERIVDLLAFSPRQMRTGFDALHARHRLTSATTTTPSSSSTSTAQPSHTKSRQLPQHVDTSTLGALPIVRSPGDLTEVAPGLWRGDVPNVGLSDAHAARNIALAEIVDRLADNAGQAAADHFVVTHLGQRFSSLPTFIEALQRDGYSIEATFTHRVADFAALKTRAPDGTLLDVPLAAMVKTGVKDAAGREAVLPSVHSEVVFSIRAGAQSTPPALEGDIKWYQGVPNTGFFPCETMRKSTWTGSSTAATLATPDAVRAMTMAAVLADVIQDVARHEGLAMSGYGVTGVCNDSVAIVQQAMTGRVTAYPLFMRDALLLTEIDRRLKGGASGVESDALRSVRAAIVAVPSDERRNATSTQRALASIPWPTGRAPLSSAELAREILTAASTGG
jgi:hypothetical protein